jgi:hypothetical protein
VAELYEHALQPENRYSIDPKTLPTKIAYNGCLVAYSGNRTGRSPKDKRVVYDSYSKDVSNKLLLFRLFGGVQLTFQLPQKDGDTTELELLIT